MSTRRGDEFFMTEMLAANKACDMSTRRGDEFFMTEMLAANKAWEMSARRANEDFMTEVLAANKAGEMSARRANEAFMTEVLAANKIKITEQLNKLEEAYSSDSVEEVQELRKMPGLFGDVEGLPVDVETSDYDEVPDTTPDKWLQRYQFEVVLKDKSKALHDKAKTAYVKRHSAGSNVNTVAMEAGTDDRSKHMFKKEAEWFDKFSKATEEFEYGESAGLSVRSVHSSGCEECERVGVELEPEVRMSPVKRGRGRPSKIRRQNGSVVGQSVSRVQTRGQLRRLCMSSAKLSAEISDDVVYSLPRRGCDRPCKTNVENLNSMKHDFSSVAAAGNLSNPRKRGRPRKYLDAEICAAELCFSCCVKLGDKFGQGIERRLLRVQIASVETLDEEEIVKCVRGGAKRSAAAEYE